MMNKKLLQQYISGTCSAAESRMVEAYLADETSDLTLLQEVLDEVWDASAGGTAEGAAAAQVLETLREKLYPPEKGSSPVRLKPASNNKSRRWWYGVAAAVAAGLLATVFFYNTTGVRKKKMEAVRWQTIINHESRTLSQMLPDSSRIWLSPHSSLTYASNFRENRMVKLEGEAFFEVAADEAHPFRVMSGILTVKVLGTAFNIETYSREKTIRISLVNGKVSVGAPQQPPSILREGEMLTYNKKDHNSSRELLKITGIDEWTQGNLVFNELPLADALGRIAARYNMEVSYGPGVQLNDKKLTTLFRKEGLDEMMKLVLFVYGYSYQKKGNVLEVIKRS